MRLRHRVEHSGESPDAAAIRELSAGVVATEIAARIIPLACVRGHTNVHVQRSIGSRGDAARAVLELGNLIDYDVGRIRRLEAFSQAPPVHLSPRTEKE
jgi:hypothetical protein